MQLGMVTDYNEELGNGSIANISGEIFSFSYKDGQNMQYGEDIETPQFTGHQQQPVGFYLKVPETGDPVTFIPSARGVVKVWGYARHFVELAERRHSTRFVG